MSAGSLFVANLVAVLLFAALLGVVLRGRASQCWSFTAYLTVALVSNRLVSWWPERFFQLWFATVKELTYVLLMVVIVAEICFAALERFPRARRQALMLGTVIAGCGAILVSSTPSIDFQARVGRTAALANGGALLVLTILLLILYWYRLPLRPWHRGIAQGFFLYRGVYGILLGAVGFFGEEADRYLVALDPAAYAATVGLWVLAAWRPERAPTAVTSAAQTLTS